MAVWVGTFSLRGGRTHVVRGGRLRRILQRGLHYGRTGGVGRRYTWLGWERWRGHTISTRRTVHRKVVGAIMHHWGRMRIRTHHWRRWVHMWITLWRGRNGIMAECSGRVHGRERGRWTQWPDLYALPSNNLIQVLFYEAWNLAFNKGLTLC